MLNCISHVRLFATQPARLLCPWDSPGKTTGVGCHALLQGIFLTQGSNPCLMALELAGRLFITSTTSAPNQSAVLSGSLWETCSSISYILTGVYMPFFIACHFSTVIKKLKTFFLSVCFLSVSSQEETFEECPMRYMKRCSL